MLAWGCSAFRTGSMKKHKHKQRADAVRRAQGVSTKSMSRSGRFFFMEQAKVFVLFTEPLEHAGIGYMATGSVATCEPPPYAPFVYKDWICACLRG